MGTMRLAIAFGAGLLALFYLILAIVPLTTGQIEMRPTSLSIETIESDGFPEPWYLEVTDGYLVFSEAVVRLERGDDPPGALYRVTVPVASKRLLETWDACLEKDEKLDASRFRLFAAFNPEQVAELWPEMAKRAEAGEALEQVPVQRTLVGDTELAKHMVFQPWDFKHRTTNFEWEQARWLRYERHFDSPGRCVKNMLIGLAWLALSVAMFTYHRSRPDDVATNVFDWSAIPHGGDEAPDIDDIDLDL